MINQLNFIDRFRFMPSSLSNFDDNLFKIFHNDKCTDCKSCLDYMPIRNIQ